jgi:hypothetical protein
VRGKFALSRRKTASASFVNVRVAEIDRIEHISASFAAVAFRELSFVREALISMTRRNLLGSMPRLAERVPSLDALWAYFMTGEP